MEEKERLTVLILDTIDQLRARKARPDSERIAHMLQRKYGIGIKKTTEMLERLTNAEIVIKVDYKGSTSYRNASKWRRSHTAAGVQNSTQTQKQLSDVVRSFGKEAATFTRIERRLLDEDKETPLRGERLSYALTREVTNGRLHFDERNGAYSLAEKRISFGEEPKVKRARSSDGEEIESDQSFISTGTEKSRVTHPDSINGQEPRCDFCQKTAECNKNGEKEDLLFCTDCRSKAHPSCMDYSKALAERAQFSPWQCIDCKTCSVCFDSGDASTMLFCDACDKGFHMECLNPPMSEKPSGKWVCNRCFAEQGTRVTSDGNAPCLPTPADSPTHFDSTPAPPNGELKRPKSSIPSKVPTVVNSLLDGQMSDASQWSIDDVVQYFRNAGFCNQADVFREQEIDGKSLLLLKRTDVLNGLRFEDGTRSENIYAC